MSRVYDNWEKLVEAVLDREELRRLAYCPSLSSTTSSADSSSRFSFQDAFVGTTDPEGIPSADAESSSNPNQVNETFTFSELAAATRNFHGDCVMDEGSFGKLYKGFLKGSNHAVTIKQFGRDGGNREFLVECLMLSLLHHPNLINLIGYCADGDHRLLVYEYFPLGSLEKYLHEPIPGKKHLDWNTRMKIAAGVAKGLEYLHHKANPPVIHRNLKPANIWLGEDFIPKMSNFGFAKLGPVGDKTHISTRVMGTFGYCDPEYASTGQLSVKADVFSFGVILLEIISGRKAVDVLESGETHNIVAWARPFFGDSREFTKLVDPALQGEFPLRPLYQAIAVAAMCVQERGDLRPTMVDVTTAMTHLSSQTYVPQQNSYSAR